MAPAFLVGAGIALHPRTKLLIAVDADATLIKEGLGVNRRTGHRTS